MANRDQPAPSIRLGPVPTVPLPEERPVEQAEAGHMRGLIARLADIDQPDFGLSQTLTGHCFAPIAGSEQVGTLLFTNHAICPSGTLRELVERGPRALPFLLAALDDQTPTGLHIGGMMGQWFGREMRGNAASAIEGPLLPVVPGRPGPNTFREPFAGCYTLKVGDVCFVAIGQIVGRPYLAVRYQPSLCVVVNSPAHDAELCRHVRAIWASDQPTRHLFASLLFDLATEPIDRSDATAVHRAATFRHEAARRLLYYYPDVGTPLIADRLHRLGSLPTVDRLGNSEEAGLVKAVAWCKEPAIRAVLSWLFQHSNDLPVCLAALPGVDPAQVGVIRAKLEAFLDDLPTAESGPQGMARQLLLALGGYGGDEARAVFQRYLKGDDRNRRPAISRVLLKVKRYLVADDVSRRLTLCQVLREVKREWDIELLSALLADRRPCSRWTYSPDPEDPDHQLPMRVCDVAAETLALNHADLPFRLAGTYPDLDRQIQTMQSHIAQGGGERSSQ
jgi:hypothetical protein